MKKVIIVILSVGLLMGILSGCNNDKKEIDELKQQIEELQQNIATPAPNAKQTPIPVQTTVMPTASAAPTPVPTSQAPVSTAVPTESPVATAAPTPTPTPTPTPAPSPTPAPQPLSMARWDGNVFVSEWAGLRLPLPAGWYKATDDEIKQVYNLGYEIIAGATGQTVEELKSIPVIYPMFIMKYPLGTTFTGMNTNIVMFFEKLTPPNDTQVDETVYLNSVKSQFGSVGYEFPSNINEIEVAGKTYRSLKAVITENSMQQIFLCRKLDNYIIGIILTGDVNNTAELEELINSITAQGVL